MSDGKGRALIDRGWELWIAGDLEAYLTLWHDDGVWTMPGNSRISGQWRGPTKIAEMARVVFEVSGGTMEARPIELAAAGDDSVLCYFHVAATRPGASIDQDGLQRYVVRDGKIASMQNMFADVAEIDAFYA